MYGEDKMTQGEQEKSSGWVWVLFIIFGVAIILGAWYYGQIYLLEEEALEQDTVNNLIPPQVPKN